MKRIINTTKILTSIILLLFCLNCERVQTETKNDFVTVEIDYGHNQEVKSKKVLWKEGMTALEALQFSESVSTHPINQFVFVTSINGVKGERGISAWYYELNGMPAKVLAINNVLEKNDVVRWIYKKDVCSKLINN